MLSDKIILADVYVNMDFLYSTTILLVKCENSLAIAGDGQVTVHNMVFKSTANKIRKLVNGDHVALAGCAGRAGQALAMLDLFAKYNEQYPGQIKRAAASLVKKMNSQHGEHSNLEAMICVGDLNSTIVIAGTGEIIDRPDGIIGIGSGGAFAISAARALAQHTDMSAEKIVTESMKIAADLCIHTNHEIHAEVIEG